MVIISRTVDAASPGPGGLVVLEYVSIEALLQQTRLASERSEYHKLTTHSLQWLAY
jgi:hypothetical protein